MKHEKKNKGTIFNSSLFFKSEFKASFVILIFSLFAFIITFTFDQVPPILNRGIQPATFPKILLTLFILILFVLIAKFLDFFLAIGTLSFLISFFWGERRIYYLFIVSIIFPIIVFIFFETILGLRFPSGIITNFYYN